MGRFVKLGKYASFFRDPNLDISIAVGDVVELNIKQLSSPRIRTALQGGHLVYTEAPTSNTRSEGREKSKEDTTNKNTPIEDLKEAFADMVNKGEKLEKIAKTFTMNDLKRLAEDANIEVEEEDTKKTICEALLEDFNSDDDSDDEK